MLVTLLWIKSQEDAGFSVIGATCRLMYHRFRRAGWLYRPLAGATRAQALTPWRRRAPRRDVEMTVQWKLTTPILLGGAAADCKGEGCDAYGAARLQRGSRALRCGQFVAGP